MLGVLHGLVDMVSLAVLYCQVPLGCPSAADIVFWALVYNLVAFGLQGPVGLLADRLQTYRAFAVAGLLIVAGAGAAATWSAPAIVVVAVGNALFHVGAGGLVLRSSGGRASLPGVFVGPGVLGLALGIALGLKGFPQRLAIAGAMAAAAALLAMAHLAPPVPVAAPAGGGAGGRLRNEKAAPGGTPKSAWGWRRSPCCCSQP